VRAAALAASVHQSLTGERVDPMGLVPARYRPPAPPTPVKSEARVRQEAAAAQVLRERFFGGG